MGGVSIYFVFILIIVLILVLVVVNAKRSKSKTVEDEEPSEPLKGSLSTVTPQEKTETASCQPSIYEYIPKKAIWICPDCDGENPQECHQCMICGYRDR